MDNEKTANELIDSKPKKKGGRKPMTQEEKNAAAKARAES